MNIYHYYDNTLQDDTYFVQDSRGTYKAYNGEVKLWFKYDNPNYIANHSETTLVKPDEEPEGLRDLFVNFISIRDLLE